MSNFITGNSEAPWTPTEVVEQESEQREGSLVRWWYSWTTPERPPINASFVRREADRRARLLRTGPPHPPIFQVGVRRSYQGLHKK
jgi:hypothetical protein